MDEQKKKTLDPQKFEVTELEDQVLEDVAGGGNPGCTNPGCSGGDNPGCTNPGCTGDSDLMGFSGGQS